MSIPLVIDIECAPTDRALEMPCPEDWLTRGIKDNFKPDTIERYRAENLASWPEEVTRRASLDWRLGRVVAVGFKMSEGTEHVYCGQSEGLLLRTLWEFIRLERQRLERQDFQLVGFNIAGFDWPWILGRSAALRILPTRKFSYNKWSPERSEIIDWQDILCNHGSFASKGYSLDTYAEIFGLPRTVGEGKDVPEWFRTGQLAKIEEHLAGDLRTTAALDQLFRPVFL